MDKMNKEVSEKYKQIFSYLTKAYNDMSKDINQSQALGKKEIYEEVLNWLATSQNNEYKYVSPVPFHNMMNEKLIKTRIALNSRPEVDDIMKVFSDIKLNENKKKIHRYIKATDSKEDASNFNAFPFNIQSSFQSSMTNNFIHGNNHNEDSSDESISSGSTLHKRKK